MTKAQALAMFNGAQGLAEAWGVVRSRIYQLPEDLKQDQADRVIGAAIRTGRPIPPEVLQQHKEEKAA